MRPGNVHSAEGWEELLLAEIERQQKQGKQVAFRSGPRGRPAFAKPEIYEALEGRGVKRAIRIPANDSLERDVAQLLRRRGPEGAGAADPGPCRSGRRAKNDGELDTCRVGVYSSLRGVQNRNSRYNPLAG